MKSPSHAVVPGCTLSTGLIPVDAGPDPSLTSLCVQPAHCECPVESHPPHFRAETLHKLLVILQGLLSPALSGPSSLLFSVVSCSCPSHKANAKAGPPVPLAPGTSGARPCSRALLLHLASGQGSLHSQLPIPPCPPILAGRTNTNWP